MIRRFLWVALLSVFSGCSPTEEFIVAEGFEGPVVVIYNDPEGVEANGVYHIPKNGKLFVKGPSPAPSHFYIYEESVAGERKKIPYQKQDATGRYYFRAVSGGTILSDCFSPPQMLPKFFTFVVTKGVSHSGQWQVLQDETARDVIITSLKRRGWKDGIDCYQQRYPSTIPTF